MNFENKFWQKLTGWLILLGLILQPSGLVNARSLVQQSDAQNKAKALLAKMTPSERVGQLFLVTFKGKQVDNTTQIYDLISNYHIGGVILRSANDNFSGSDTTITDAYQLNTRLQDINWESSQTSRIDPQTKTTYSPQFIPLFIGISQEGDGYPNDQILNGLTPLPDQMAIGATWKPELSKSVGNVLGKELSNLGFNLLIGPSLDVLDILHTEGGDDLGTRTFGGDPYWVGEMGKSFIAGVHEGSHGSMAVIAKHFPGRGGTDRSPEEEVATVRKSLEQLKQIELAPFFSVTGNAPDKASTTDGLLVTHIRYQGFQGNIRATTRPVSFDPAALEQLMGLPPFTSWRTNGGIVVSDNLGSQAVRRFYDPLGRSFDARQVARNAFLAGNDLLYLDNFVATGDPDSYTTILRTLESFSQKYKEDPAFAQRVDASTERLLTLKFSLYPSFSLDQVKPLQGNLNEIGSSQQVSFEVAQRAVTLLSPDPKELAVSLPQPPQTKDRLVFITDSLAGKQCSQCPDQVNLPVDAFQKSVVKLYGPRAGEQVMQYRLTSYSFIDLLNYLNNAPQLPPIETDLKSADWIVFGILNTDPTRPEPRALKRLLSERTDLLANKKVLVFAFNAPYYLDATDVSKLSAYYGVYSKIPAFVDVAARILFQELAPTGALPISVPGVGYDLIKATSPDPAQVIPLFLDLEALTLPQTSITQVSGTPQAASAIKFKVGDSIPLRTGVIYDHNHNQVPDGTVVRFLFTTGGESGIIQQIETTTTQGIAKASYRIANNGLLEIRVVSDPATVSELLQLAISATGAAAITSVAPSPVPTLTPEPTLTNTPVITPTVIIVKTPETSAPNVGNWLFSLILIWGSAAGVYWSSRNRVNHRWALRWAFLVIIGGFMVYLLLASGAFKEFSWTGFGGLLRQTVLILGGIAVGLITGWFWWRRTTPRI